ncbi:MAG: heavy-metal-associated domain-containing protein, partial [Methylacidiphilales bacterium]|nr:heavy-metal-associated domain-containing protein [Candidatus Methylacidiphilales bacterium]
MTLTPRHAASPSPGPAAKAIVLDVTGMTCAACSARVERVLSRLPGVEAVSVNLPLERADIRCAPAA